MSPTVGLNFNASWHWDGNISCTKTKTISFSYINQKPMWLLNNFESNLYFVNYIPKIVFLYLPPMDQLSSPNLLLSPSATLILTNSLPIYWSLWLSLSISIDHPVSASFEQVGQCTNATLLKTLSQLLRLLGQQCRNPIKITILYLLYFWTEFQMYPMTYVPGNGSQIFQTNTPSPNTFFIRQIVSEIAPWG